jgi:hypothetical protein
MARGGGPPLPPGPDDPYNEEFGQLRRQERQLAGNDNTGRYLMRRFVAFQALREVGTIARAAADC